MALDYILPAELPYCLAQKPDYLLKDLRRLGRDNIVKIFGDNYGNWPATKQAIYEAIADQSELMQEVILRGINAICVGNGPQSATQSTTPEHHEEPVPLLH